MELESGAAASSESAASSSESASSSSSSSVDTASVAASVIADMDAGSSSGEAAPSPVVKAEAKADAKPEIDPDDFDAVPSEVTDSMGRKKANSIPHPRVTKMIAKAQNKVIAAVAKELGITKAEAELKLEDITGALTERSTKYKTADERLANVDAIEQIMATDGDRMIRMLADANPQLYGKFAKILDQVQAQAEREPSEDNDPEPQPDYDLGDGTKTFSMAQLAKARAWDRRQAKRDAMRDVDARLKPFDDDRKAIQDRKNADAFAARTNEAVSAQLAKAKKWHGFEENSAEILKALKTNPALDLFDAYQSVVMPKIAADRQKMREELIAEQNGQPRNTSAASTAAATKPSDKVKGTRDIAAEVMRQFEGN